MDYAQLREQTPALHGCTYLQTGGIAPSPMPVVEEVKRWLDLQNEGPAVSRITEKIRAMEQGVVERAARVIGAHADEVALTRNVTEGINIVGNGLDWSPGDEVIISDQEHPGNMLLWFNLSRRYGVKVKVLPLTNDRAALLNRFADLLGPRTRLVSISHVSRRSGLRLPARELCQIAHERGVLVLLDGAQAVGNIPFDVKELGCDFYAFCGHKWMLGPKGTGAVYVKRELFETIKPSWIGCHAEKFVELDGSFELLDSARRYEFGTRDIATVAGWGKAIDILEEIGFDAIHARIAHLSTYAKQALAQLSAIRVVSPARYDESSGIVTVEVSGADSRALHDRLMAEHRVLVGPEPDGWLRLCWHCFNTEAEVDLLARALQSSIG